jgi:hypothetical protein
MCVRMCDKETPIDRQRQKEPELTCKMSAFIYSFIFFIKYLMSIYFAFQGTLTGIRKSKTDTVTVPREFIVCFTNLTVDL